ncbi:MAG: hypothetical protein GY884_28045 [Proteobacteria bacterium]|nr:hypothetical protein [Pseudomonadota bacterium]
MSPALLAVLATLGGEAQAQEPTSLQPTLLQLESLLVELERQQIQLTELAIGPLRQDTVGASFPIPLAAGEDLRIIGLGDPERMLDMNLYVLDWHGEVVAADVETDNMPMVEFVAPADGIYDIRLILVEPQEGHDFGFYTLAVGYPLSIPPVSSGESFADTIAATLAMEDQGIQPVTVQWRTISEGSTAFVQHHVGDWDVCTVFAGGTPSRTRRLDLYVGDPFDQPRAHSRKDRQRAFAMFEPVPSGEWMFGLHARSLQRGYEDTHGVLAVGCR